MLSAPTSDELTPEIAFRRTATRRRGCGKADFFADPTVFRKGSVCGNARLMSGFGSVHDGTGRRHRPKSVEIGSLSLGGLWPENCFFFSTVNGFLPKGGFPMYRVLRIMALGTLGVVLLTQTGQGDEPDKLKELMKRKLTSAQKVLEGIAVKDFDLIAKHAEELQAVGKAAQFRVVKTPRFEVYSNDFQRNAENLARQAKEKNLDGAALAYVDLTLNCVKCHKHIREVNMGRLDRGKDDEAERARAPILALQRP
jgi:hypothetical protein